MKAKQKIKLIEDAIDVIIRVGEDIPGSDAGYFINSENSVVSELRSLMHNIENDKLSKLEKGNIVEVYQRPLTKDDFEGKAKLIRKTKQMNPPKGFEYWEVQFISDGSSAMRLIERQ
jgi:hypothetical protein